VHAQIAAGLDVVVHLVRDRDGRRRWSSLSVAERRDGLTVLVDALSWPTASASVERGAGFDRLRHRLGEWAPGDVAGAS
jgi:pilus assembly protein CpaF